MAIITPNEIVEKDGYKVVIKEGDSQHGKVSKECYKQFGKDLDGCSRQQNQGCKGCRCLYE